MATTPSPYVSIKERRSGGPDLSGQSVHAATRRTLLKIKGFSEVKVEKVKEAIAKCQVSRGVAMKHVSHPDSTLQPTVTGFVTAMELGHLRKRVFKISTGSKQLDAILGG